MQPEFNIKVIKYNSQEFQQACQLRYELFFSEHNLPWDLVQDQRQQDYFHAAIPLKVRYANGSATPLAIATQDQVVAYGQLVPQENGIYQIRQMVVHPSYQRQNLGSQILLFLIREAKQAGAIALTLNARLSAIGFYQKFGFQTQGEQFPSSTTGILHITLTFDF
jgi:predicted GNAT family N-acyltransferase